MSKTVTPQQAAEEQAVQLCSHQEKLYLLSSTGRLFYQVLDPRNFNTDGRNEIKHIWREVELPF